MDFSKQTKCRTLVVMRNEHKILSRRSEIKMLHGRSRIRRHENEY